MKRKHIYIIMCILGLMVGLTACNDVLIDDSALGGDDGDKVGFALYVSEQADMHIGLSTRSSSSELSESAVQSESAGAVANTKGSATVRLLEGENPYGLKMQRMTLPYVGIHPRAVKADCNGNTETLGNAAGTRAHESSIVRSAATFHDSLTVWGYTRDAGTVIFDKTLVQRSTNWRTSGHWPYGETGLMRFYAVSPSLESINMSVADADYATAPVLTYTQPEKASEMCDLLYGESGDIDIAAFGLRTDHVGKDDKMVNLQFQHILTAVRFAQGKIPTNITIKRISLNGVRSKGTFAPAATDPVTGTMGTWSGLGTAGNYTMYANFTGTGSENTYVNDSVFYMIPQTVPSGVELEIDIEKSGDPATHVLRCSLEGDIWKKGYSVTYKITIGEVSDSYYFLVDAPAENQHSDVATHLNFPVHSYRLYIDYEPEPAQNVTTHGVNWQVVGYYSDSECNTPFDGANAANPPAWLSGGVTGNSTGTLGIYAGGNESMANYELLAQSPTKGGNHATILSANSAARTDALTWDLSAKYPDGTARATTETANCYIVNRTGSYKFPLVYGNKAGDGSESSFFVDHTGTTIDKKRIMDQIQAKNPAADAYETIVTNASRKRTAYSWNTVMGLEPVSLRAVLVWEDVNGLVSGISTSSDPSNANAYDNVVFTVNSSTPGNAVIALQARKVTKYEKSEDSGVSWSLDATQGTSDIAGYDVGAWETLWTWHIWMTDEVYANVGTNNTYGSRPNDEMYLNWNSTDNNHLVNLKNWGTDGTDGSTTKILPVNLGWVPQSLDFSYYSPREVYVKLKQAEPAAGAMESVVKIVQHARQPLVRGVGTFYQWGRPTALPGHNWPDNASPKTKREIYRNSSVFSDFTLEDISQPYDAIAQPTKLFRINDGLYTRWSSSSSSAYWGATKTVYDPCPPGFQLPPMSVFTGFSTTGETVGTGESDKYRLNMWEDAGETFYGGYFYVEPHVDRVDSEGNKACRYDQTVYMPSTGQYQATKRAGYEIWNSVSPDNTYIETMPGTVWSYEKNGDNEHGHALNLYADFDRADSGKPAVQLPRNVNLSTAVAIRPMVRPTP